MYADDAKLCMQRDLEIGLTSGSCISMLKSARPCTLKG